jgi:hypothetical protein
MSEYASRNEGFGVAAKDPDTTPEPSPEEIESWNTKDSAPSASNGSEDPNQQSTEDSSDPTPEVKEDGAQPEQKPEEAKKKTPLQAHRENKEFNKQLNELHKNLRLEQKKTRELQQKLTEREQGLDKSPEEWLQLAQYFENQGDFQKAEAAKQEANRLQQYQTQYKSQAEKVQIWEECEREIQEQDADFMNPGTDLDNRMRAIMDSPQGDFYREHPMGVWAAYHRAKFEHAQTLIPQLVKLCEYYQGEWQKLAKSQSPITSAPPRSGSQSIGEMNLEDLEKAALAEAQRIDAGRTY